jgi:putative peptidoglycan lipid II flippase
MDSSVPGQHSYRRGIALSTAMSLVARGIVFLTAVAIAYRFGTTEATDVFFYCYLLATATVGFVTMLDSMVVIPEVQRLQVQEDQETAMAFANAVLYGCTALAVAAGALVATFPLAIVGAGSRFSAATLEANRLTILLVVPLFVSAVVGQYLLDLLTSQRYFTLPMVSNAVNYGIALVAVLVFGRSTGPMIIPLAFTIGLVIQVGALGLLLKRGFGWRFGVVAIPRRRWFARQALLSQGAGLAALIGSALPSYLMSGIGPGLLTALQYGQRTAELPTQIVTGQVSAVAGIKLNDLAARSAVREMDDVFLRLTRLLLSVLVPVAVMISVYSPEVVTLFYGHGEFDAEAVAKTSGFLRGLALAAPFLAMNTLASRLAMARQAIAAWTRYVVGLNAALSVWTFVVIWWFGPWWYPWGLAVFQALSMGALHAFMRRHHREISVGAAVGTFGRLLPPTAAVAALLAGSKILLAALPGWVAIAAGALIYGAAILLFPGRFLPFPEAREVLGHGSLVQRARRLIAVARGSY